MLLNNQEYLTQPTLINLHSNGYTQEFHYYPFVVKLHRCVESGNILKNLSKKVCAPKKKIDLNHSVFNMITKLNESKTLTKHISCACKCIFDGKKCNSDQWWDNHKCWCGCKKRHVSEKG